MSAILQLYLQLNRVCYISNPSKLSSFEQFVCAGSSLLTCDIVSGLNDRSRLRPFETSGTTYPTTKRRISEDLNTQQHRCENLKSYGLYIIIFSKFQNLQRKRVVIITSLCCFSLRHRYAYVDKDPQCLPPPHTHTQTHKYTALTTCSTSYALISKLFVTRNGEN